MPPSPRIDFGSVAAAALRRAPELLAKWFPAGVRRGAEFVVGNLRGDPGESLSINLHKGFWGEFAGGPTGRDLIGFYAAMHGLSQLDAARGLARELGLDAGDGGALVRPPRRPAAPLPPSPPAAEAEAWAVELPVPADAPPPPALHRRFGEPEHVAAVLDAGGRLLFRICRFPPHGGRKQIVPQSFGTVDGLRGWHWKAPPAPRPLYGLELLAAHPGLPVLVVEGERKAEAARRLLGARCVVVSWPNGAKGVRNAEWSALAGRDVRVWPDNDAPGVAAAKLVADLALGAGAASAVPLPPPDGAPEKWDLDDAEREGWDGTRVWSHITAPRCGGPQASGNVVALKPRRSETLGRGKRGIGGADPGDLDGYELTEDGIALAFAAKHREDLRFDHQAGKWFVWNGAVWRPEETKLAFSWARQACRERARASGAEDKLKAVLAKASTAAAVERFAQADRTFAVTSETWDRDPFLLGTPDGTVDLRTGELRRAERDEHITKAAAVAPAKRADCPLWLRFLRDATAGDEALVAFLRRFCGYLLTGDIREHAFLFVYGPGGNGKGTFVDTVTGVLGDYYRNAAMETFTESRNGQHLTFLAMLNGARLVTASETNDGRAWNEELVKRITGGDPITANFMRRDPFTFVPQFKLLIAGNHRPVLRNVDDAARRRFNIVPFLHKPPVDDKQLRPKLRDEWPGILRWMVDGCIEWQQFGLPRPRVVVEATEAYFAEQDTMRQWLEACCEVGERRFSATSDALFKSWTGYALAAGEPAGSKKKLAQWLEKQEFRRLPDTPGHRKQRGFEGIRLRQSDMADHWQDRGARADP